MKSDLLDMVLTLHGETDLAIRVSDTGADEDAVWLPKSQIEYERRTAAGVVEVTIPEWLASKKGLI